MISNEKSWKVMKSNEKYGIFSTYDYDFGFISHGKSWKVMRSNEK